MVLEKWGQEAWKTAEGDDEHSAQVPRSGSGEHHTWSWEESTEQRMWLREVAIKLQGT